MTTTAPKTTPERAPGTVPAMVGPESDSFWTGRVKWVAECRRHTGCTIREAMDEWEKLSGIGMFEPKHNAPAEAGAEATSLMPVVGAGLENR